MFETSALQTNYKLHQYSSQTNRQEGTSFGCDYNPTLAMLATVGWSIYNKSEFS